jgi:predicted  nucleic acid-binding Zn-ribbon protein
VDSENTSIELEKRLGANDQRKNNELNARINTYNAKSSQYNRSLAEIKGKEAVLNSMIEEYNRTLQTYKDCLTSG